MNNIIRNTGDQIFIEPKKDYLINGPFTSIDIKETKKVNDTEHGILRMYQNYTGDSTKNENGFILQIRAYQSLTDTTKKRNIIASIKITDSEIRALAEFVKEVRTKHNTVKLNIKEPKFYLISGYWKNNKKEFINYLVSSNEHTDETTNEDNKIFFYGLPECEIKQAIKERENNSLDFVITSYNPY